MSFNNPFFKYFKNRDSYMRHLFRPVSLKTKKYEHTELQLLPNPKTIEDTLSMAYTNRQSGNSFSNTTLDMPTLSTLLYWSLAELGERPDGQGYQPEAKTYRPYPSGGAKYPIETYLCLDLPKLNLRGLYHYRPDEHALEKLLKMNDADLASFKKAFSYTWVADVPVLFLFSYIMERNVPKYGLFGYKLGLIEAGHIGQNIYLNAAALGVIANALGGFDESIVHELLQLDGYNETAFYAIAVGKKE